MPQPVWIVVANGSRARVFQRESEGAPLVEVKDWLHPGTRQHPQDLKGGHRTSGMRGRSGLAERSHPHDHERDAFAHEISQWLTHATNSQAIHRIALLSSHPFLDDLMACAQGAWHQHLCATHAVDLTRLPMAELEQRLRHDYRL